MATINLTDDEAEVLLAEIRARMQHWVEVAEATEGMMTADLGMKTAYVTYYNQRISTLLAIHNRLYRA